MKTPRGGSLRPCRIASTAVVGKRPEATSSTIGDVPSGIFEVGGDGWPVRQVEVYDAGRVSRYGAGREEDRYGGLSQASLYDSDEDWGPFEITAAEFERVWDSDGG